MKEHFELFQQVEDALSNSDYARMMAIAEPLANSGVAWVKATVASLFHLGLGVHRDLNKAEALYLEAYEAGDELAMIDLVAFYEVAQQPEKANKFRLECISRGCEFYGPDDKE